MALSFRAGEDATHPSIILTEPDLGRLRSLLSTRVGVAYRTEASELRRAFHRAVVVRAIRVPKDVVTMNSTVDYEDVRAGRAHCITVVYPWRAHERATASVLSPLGTALLGLRVGDSMSCTFDDGSLEVRVLGLRYQPEAAGDWHL